MLNPENRFSPFDHQHIQAKARFALPERFLIRGGRNSRFRLPGSPLDD
jgi:hypothetical protein